MQAAFQRHVDNAVSKTLNLPQGASVAEVDGIYRRAWRLGLKGVTVFRHGCSGAQVIQPGLVGACVAGRHEGADRPSRVRCGDWPIRER